MTVDTTKGTPVILRLVRMKRQPDSSQTDPKSYHWTSIRIVFVVMLIFTT